MEILGVKISPVTKSQAIAKIGDFLDAPTGRMIVTPNPEIILYAQRHPAYRETLNGSDLALPDGFGLLLASRFVGQGLPERVSGSDMLPEICRLAKEKRLKIALLGGLNQAAIEAAAAKMREWGNEVVFAQYGVAKDDWNNRDFHDKIVRELAAAEPQVLFVGFGHPKQEIWISEWRSRLPSIRLFMGCGGALDFVAGAAKRAPAALRRLGLEWLWRLCLEPARYRRIFNAVIVFPLTVIYDRFRKK